MKLPPARAVGLALAAAVSVVLVGSFYVDLAVVKSLAAQTVQGSSMPLPHEPVPAPTAQAGGDAGASLGASADHSPAADMDGIERADPRKRVDGVDRCVDDPLDPECALVAYPANPLTAEQIKMCDPTLHAHLPHGKKEHLCPEDPTCKKCRSHYDEVKNMIDSFRSADLTARRRKEFQKRFTKVGEDGQETKLPVVVVGMNMGQVYLFLNWACSVHALGMDPREFTYVVTTDALAHSAVEEAGFLVESLEWLERSGVKISERYKGFANIGPHAQINTMIAAGAEALVLAGHPAFLMDVDVVWLRNPFPFFAATSYRRDMVGSYSPREDSYGYVNGGAVLFVPTKKTKVFISTWVNLCMVKKQSDQIVLNTLIRYFRFRQLAVAITPHSIFNTHWSRGQLKHLASGDRPYLAHTVGLNKAKRFMTLGFWFHKRECPYFDQASLNLAVKEGLINATDIV